MRVLGGGGHDVCGLDILDSAFTSVVGSVADRACVRDCVKGVDAVLHAATLHEPHVGSHGRRDFVDTNRDRHPEPARGGGRYTVG